MIDGLKKTGLEDFQVSIGHVDFIQGLLDETGFEEEELDQLIELINNRNYFGVDEIMEASSVRGSVRDAFRILPKLTGDVDVLEQAADIAPTVNAGLAIEHLRKMYEMLKMYGVEKYITFDLSLQGSYGYYTGIVFRAYTYGTGDAVVRGGRYDHLVEKFPDHFGVQFSNLLHGIVGIIIQIGAAGQINGTHCQSLIHRQQKTSIPLNPCFISQSL